MDSKAQRLFDQSLLVGQMLSDGFRRPADQSRESLERQARIAGCTVEQYLFYPAWTWPKPPPPPTKAEIREDFFDLSEWTKGSRQTNGKILNKSGENVSLPTKAEMEFILEKAKERKKERMTDDEINHLISLFNIHKEKSKSEDKVVDPDVQAVELMRKHWEMIRRHQQGCK
jgi:hypothetical protein